MSKILVWSYFYQRDNCVYIKNGRPLWKKVTTKVTNPIDGGTFLRAYVQEQKLSMVCHFEDYDFAED